MVLSPGHDRTRGSETLASYLPALVLRDLAGDAAEITTPHAETGPAAVLFADLAGFTALAEQLSTKGPRGAEELSHIIDAHFVRLTDIALAAGGDVLAYAGDAALVAWPAGGHDQLVEALARAATAGLGLQAPIVPPAAGALQM